MMHDISLIILHTLTDLSSVLDMMLAG